MEQSPKHLITVEILRSRSVQYIVLTICLLILILVVKSSIPKATVLTENKKKTAQRL